MVKCVSFSLTSDTNLFVSSTFLSGGCEIFDCISLNSTQPHVVVPVCVTFHCTALQHTSEIRDFTKCEGSVQVTVCDVNIDGS